MRLQSLVIPNGATSGTPIDVLDIEELTIYGPSALTGVISIEVTPDGTNWYPRVGIPAVDLLIDVQEVRANQMRLVSTIAEGAERTFPVYGSSKVVV